MTIESEITALADRVRNHAETIATEEATKTSIVLPFLRTLGYDVFNPEEVVPEFTADAVGKKAEKVDYAIRLNGDVQVLIECKGLSTKLSSKHLSQLFRYFTVTSAKFAVLTNGQIFEFYSDLEEPNKLDKRPFFSFDLLDFTTRAASELSKFEKANFDVDSILATAERLKYLSSVKRYLRGLIENPSDPFVRLVAGEVYEGRVSAQVREQMEAAVRTGFREIIREQVRSRLSSALENSVDAELEPSESAAVVETTAEEIEGMLTIRAIVRQVIDGGRVDLRDAKSYCAVLVDDNNRKPLARMHFNRKQWYLGLFDGDTEDRVAISSLGEIYEFSDRLIQTAKRYI